MRGRRFWETRLLRLRSFGAVAFERQSLRILKGARKGPSEEKQNPQHLETKWLTPKPNPLLKSQRL